MSRRVPLKELHDDRFLREIHHFLWTPPSVVGRTTDAGWNCRDHAWVIALLARSLGYRAALFHGEAFFTRGPSGKSASVSISQQPHSWVMVEEVGAIDLSIRPDASIGGGDYRIPIHCIFADSWLPRGRGKVHFVEDASTYARAVEALPQVRNQATAVYRFEEAEQLHDGLVTRAAGWIRSSLTARLDAVYGEPSDLYAALVLHLRTFLEGDAQSLTGLPATEAWNWLARTRELTIERACRLIEA